MNMGHCSNVLCVALWFRCDLLGALLDTMLKTHAKDAYQAFAFLRKADAADKLPDLLQYIDGCLEDDPFGESRIDETLSAQHKTSIEEHAPAVSGSSSSSSGYPIPPLAPHSRGIQRKLSLLKNHLVEWGVAVQGGVLALEFAEREWLRKPRDGILSLAFVTSGGVV